MPEKEFELYLSLLGRLLRLSPQQKTSIEAELRDHFEERFEALVRSGVPRDQAIQKTLDEFGDVAGLANQFTHLSRKHIRRRIMQGTAATAGFAAAVVIWAALFRDPAPAVGPPPNVVAQDNGDQAKADAANAEDTGDEYRVEQLDTIAAETGVEYIDPGQFLSEKLRKEIDVELAGYPLRDVINYIAEVAELPILLDTATLAEQGITGDEEVSLVVRQLPVHTLLTLLLANVNDVELAWMENAEVIQVTTKEVADDTQTTQYYNVRDLLKNGYTHDQLIDLLLEMTEGPWESIDGIGGPDVAEFGDLLVVRQCQRTQIDVACTLAGLRSKAPIRVVGSLPAEAKIHAALDSLTTIEFNGTPLRDVITYVSEMHDIPILLDTPSLAGQGLTGDEEVSLVVKRVKLRNALRLLLGNVNDVKLDVVIENGLMSVTTKEVADDALQTVLYDVAEITADDPLQMDKLEDIIENQTEGPWKSIDGIGGLLKGPSADLLACRQSRPAQDEVAAVLQAIRDSLHASGGDRSSLTEYETRLETRFYRMDAEAAEDVARLIPSLIEPGTWKVPSPDPLDEAAAAVQIGSIQRLAAGRMLLQLESGKVVESGQKQPLAASAPDPSAPAPVSSPHGAANNVSSDVVVIPQAVLIITHKPAVLRQVSKLLQSLLSGDGGWTRQDPGDKVKFIAPGYQEGTWKGSLGNGVVAPSGGFGGGGFFSLEPSLIP